MSDADESKPESLTPAALRAGVKLQAGTSLKISVVGKVGRPLADGRPGRKRPGAVGDDAGDATGAAAPGKSGAAGKQKFDSTSADGSTAGEGLDIEWSFVKHDGTPLADQKCTIVADDGTQLVGQLVSGVLKMRVPPGHLLIEVEGHIIGQVNAHAA